MVDAAEGATAKQGIAANLSVGVDTLSGNDEVTFTKYVRLVLPLDGYVFWVKTDLVSSTALLNMARFNSVYSNKPLLDNNNVPQIKIKGSFHYSTTQAQNEAETEGTNTVVFTAEEPVQQFNDLQPDFMWIGDYGGDLKGYDGPIKFGFSSRGRYYQEADLYHYVGIAVLPVFETQLIDRTEQLYARGVIMSDSLPIWLLLRNYLVPWTDRFNNSVPLYPSFLLPSNLPAPYGVVHVESTESLQEAPLYDRHLSQNLLCVDKVRVTLYGLNNDAAMLFLSAVLQYSYDYNTIGMVNMPSVKEEKRTASELSIIAQKKKIDFEVCYNQGTLREVTRQMICCVIPNYLPQPLNVAPPSVAVNYHICNPFVPNILPFTPPLDPIASVGRGYSFRRLFSDYAGFACRVQRAGHSVEDQIDIGFDTRGNFDMTLLTSYAGPTGTVNLVTWYDQSGHGLHLHTFGGDFSTSPALVVNGSLAGGIGSRVSALMTNTYNNWMVSDLSASVVGHNKGTIFAVANATSGLPSIGPSWFGSRVLLGASSSNPNGASFDFSFSQGGTLYPSSFVPTRYTGSWLGSQTDMVTPFTYTYGTNQIFSFRFKVTDPTPTKGYIDGGVPVTNLLTTGNDDPINFVVGMGSNSFSRAFDGLFTEVITFIDELSIMEANTVGANQSAYYGIPYTPIV